MKLPRGTGSFQLKRDGTLISVGLLVGWLASHACERSHYQSPSKPIELSAQQADRRVEQAKARLADHPEDLDALSELAIGNFLKGPDAYADGINAIEKARALGSTDERLFFYAGVMYDALGLPDYAANEFSRYLRHHPNDYESLVRLANVLFRDKRYDEARALYQKALNEWPKDPTVWFNYAVVATAKADADEADHALNEVVKLAGRLPEGGLYLRGEVARLKNADDVAIQQYQAELTAHPDYRPALEALAEAQKRRGLTKDARATLKRLLELRKGGKLEPGSPPPANSASSSSPSQAPKPLARHRRRTPVEQPPVSSASSSSSESPVLSSSASSTSSASSISSTDASSSSVSAQ